MDDPVRPIRYRVYAVEWGNEFPAEIDSLWTTREEAERRVEELGGRWDVSEWTVRETWEPEAGPQADVRLNHAEQETSDGA